MIWHTLLLTTGTVVGWSEFVTLFVWNFVKFVYHRKQLRISNRPATLRGLWHNHDIDFVRWLHPAMWHVALESWQWIHQVAAPCNVIRGSGMTCHWIRPNVRHTAILHLVSISTHHRSRHVILYQSAKFYPNRTTTISRKEWRHIDFKDSYRF